jgi:tetratricopeptide (TPR) repeat protein
MIQIRQKLLGQKDISESDYYEYFYQAFYKPYSLQEQAAIYEENKILSEMYVTNCITTHTGANMDVCTYGKIGLALTKDKAIPASESTNLVTLAEKYNESYLFRIIGDVYLRQNNREESKKNYAKALSLSTNSKEQDILKIKISQIQ